MNNKCFLIAHINAETLAVEGVGTYSAEPWLLTRRLGKGREVMAIVMETVGDSYQEALDDMHKFYPKWEPDLAARFPLPEPTSGDATCIAEG